LSKSKFTIIFILVKKFILFILQSLYLRDKRKKSSENSKRQREFSVVIISTIKMDKLDVKRFHSINNSDFWPSSC
jgi:hypothetical protein